jgi:acyl-homoserine-lactone acylase
MLEYRLNLVRDEPVVVRESKGKRLYVPQSIAQAKKGETVLQIGEVYFADDKGEIAYLHPQFVPRRDDGFDFTKPVDGANPATDWGSLHALSELPNVVSPPNGWVQNTNAWPYRAAGAFSPDSRRYPKYMDTVGENFRGVHAQQLLAGSRGWTLDRLQAAAYDSFQPGFAVLIPGLLRAYAALPASDARHQQLSGPIGALRRWDYRWSASSIAQTLAIYWGEKLIAKLAPPPGEDKNRYMNRLARDTTAEQKIESLSEAVAELGHDFGRWQVPWGEANRFQRISSSIDPQFSDDGASIPVPFASAKYGSLASIEMRVPQTTRRLYGNYGNSFVAVIEFGPRVRARAVTAGGESGHAKSPHFNDEALRYASGALRDVYFYPDQLKGHTERVYHPGD